MKNRNSERARSVVVLTAVLLINGLAWQWPSPARGQQSVAPKRVLVLYWYNKDYLWNVEFDRSFKFRLDSSPPGSIEYYQEYLESNRFPGEREASLFRDYLRKKYADHPIDVVVATSDVSLEFLIKDRGSLFPRVPIVFVATQYPTIAETTTESGLTGIINIATHRRTVDLALSLHPGTEQVFVVSGTLEHDKRLERMARQELQGYEGRVQITYLTDLSSAQLIEKMKSLVKRSIVLYVWEQSKSEQGKLLESIDLFDLIAPHTHVPIYGMVLPLVGRGVVGGYVNTGDAAGTKIAEIVLRIATGTRAVDIPVERAPAEPIFDWRELRRWGIRENELPRESLIRFRERTLWDQYKWRIFGIAVLILVQTMLIWGLLIQRRARRKLYTELQRSEVYLAEAQRLSQTGSFGWKPDTGELVWSDETYRIFEYDRSVKPTIDSVMQRVHSLDRADFQKVIDGASRGATGFEHAYRLLLTDGRVKYVHAIAHVLQDASGNREFVGAVTDITERKTTEDKIRRLVEADILGIFIANAQGEIVEANQAFLQMLQYGRQDLVSGRLRWTDLTPAELRERDERALTEALATGVFQPYEKEFLRKDGSRLPVLIGGALFQSAKEGVVFVLDLSEQKRAEESLRRSESYLAEAQRLSHTGSWAWSPDTDVRYWSEECYRVLGFDPRDGLPRMEEFIQRIHPDDQPAFRESAKRARHSKLDEEVDYRIVHPGGAVRDIHSIGHPVFSPCGDLIEYTGTVIDVTERKRAEEELRRSEMDLRQMLELAPQQVAVFGPAGERLYANRIGLDYLGLSLEEWRETPGNFFSSPFFHPDDRERAARAFPDSTRSSGSAYGLELRVRGADGNYRWFLVRFNPLHDDKGQVKRWYVALTDIDERKGAEERLQQENVALREEIDKASMFEEIVGTSPALKSALSRISKVAPSDSTVLITGETGTGKELVARAIHRRSDRTSRAFVSVNCAAIPRDLIASELFGHEKGSFTGATQQRLGRFELANGGTLFLDEVGELPAETQIALLRVLQEHEFERVGGTRPIRADVRVIAATNRNLQAAISAGSFRSDLFYRLNVFPIEIPSLRERREDIPLLVEYFIDRYARKAGKNIRGVNKNTLQLLQSYPWPGNIRELQNIIERSVIVCETENFSVDESWLSRQPVATEPKNQPDLPRKLAAQEKEMIEAALRESRGRVSGPSGAAAKLGISGSTLETKIRSLKIDKNRFKTAGPLSNHS
ncbi:MAG TPA: sigma 54-interacting transcriptional regulator [Terriglobales bacterium]|nr:sigma 54-interacting transcriptional regulator [Terriglobales bacterium]